MPDILLATLNAKYPHAAFGLRYLLANLPPALASRAAMLEFDISQRPLDIVERILAAAPKIVGLGVYIWNVEQSTKLAADLKRLRPDLTLIIGGPEVSYETDQQEITQHADYILTGEADLAFGQLCERLLTNRNPPQKIIEAGLPEFSKDDAIKQSKVATPQVGSDHSSDQPKVFSSLPVVSSSTDSSSACVVAIPEPSVFENDFPSEINRPHATLTLPYHLYTDEDLRHRVVYVEASRGCPFKCEFCLSSLDIPVRNAPLKPFLEAMQSLLDRGLRQFKFVDRTFNLNLKISRAILEFFLERFTPGLFLHFEMIPDRLPEGLRELIAKFPAGALQFEVGIQTFNPIVCELISRRQDNARLEDNLRWLREHTGVHVHTDLIVGLPGEDVASFAQGFDRLVAMRPQEIQVGILKRLRGTPIIRHDAEWQMVYSPNPPYEILQTKLIDFDTMQRLRRFSRYWDLVGNSGNFRQTLAMLLGESPFANFLRLSDRLFQRVGRNHGIALQDLAEFLFTHLTTELGHDAEQIAAAVWADYQRAGRSDRPPFLRPYIAHLPIPRPAREASGIPRRQAKHMG